MSNTNTHHMVTRAKAGISKPLERMNCHITTTSPIPRSHIHALRDPHWNKAMVDEYNALISNGTWVLVPRPTNVNVVRSMWLFRHKYNADGSLSRYKARLVANGRSQQQGIDCDETFSPVVKPATIRTVLSLAVSRDWPIHQLDVKNAFLHGQLSETVYMHQPPGFVDTTHPDYVCHLQRSLYGLKQAPRAWFQRFTSFITRVGFQHSKTDASLFVFHRGSDIAYLLLYVDDIILTASSTALLQRIITVLHGEFAMTDLGSLNYFLGISAQRSSSGLFLSQSKFAEEILERAHMQHCNPCRTPVDTESKLGSDGDPVSDPTLYRSLAGALQYLTFTRPDISYAVQQVCLYMHDPRAPHFTALKRILRYVRGTLTFGLQIHASTTAQLTAYTDADWAGCPVTRRSTSGYCVFLGDNLLSWSAKRQVTLSRSSAEAEYRGVANVVAETAWIRNLLLELHAPLTTATLVYCDNVSAVYLTTNPVQHQRTKHIEIDIHFVRDYVASGQVRVLHIPSRFQYADIFTKGLPSALFCDFRSSLNVRRSPVLTAGEY
ncbi:ribonuclease H-like domain-containing protein [Tanacetum coccineum]